MRDEVLTPAEVDQCVAELCRRNFYVFIQEFWSEVIQETPIWNWHIEFIAKKLQQYGLMVKAREHKKSDLIINVPPGTSKSTICTIMFPVWCWTIDPSMRILTASYSADLSMDHAVKSRDIIQSDKFRRYFPDLKIRIDQNNKSYYKNTFGGERYATSVGGTITGKHAHILIVDDPINPKGAKSAALLKEANNFMDHTLSSRKVDKAVTPTILIMQRLSESDPTQNMLDKEGKSIEHICLPASDDGSVSPSSAADYYVNGLLDPIRLSQSILNEAKSDLGSYDFAGQYQQRPAPSEGGLIKKDYFEIVDRLPNNTSTTNAYIDTAYTAKQENDPSGILSVRKIGNIMYVVRYDEVRAEFSELCEHIENHLDVYGTAQSRIYVEPKASGKSVVQYLRKQTKLNVIEYTMPEGDKVARTNANQPIMEGQRVKLLKGSWNARFMDALAMFPNAKHDEAVDCLNMAIEQELKRTVVKPRGYGYVDNKY